MINKELRVGEYIKFGNNENFLVSIDVDFNNTKLIEPFLEISVNSSNNRSIKELNAYYENIKSRLTEPLTNNQKPFDIRISYDVVIDGETVNVVQNLTNILNQGKNKLNLLSLYTTDGVSLGSIIDEKPYTINKKLELSVSSNKITHTQTSWVELTIHKSLFWRGLVVS